MPVLRHQLFISVQNSTILSLETTYSTADQRFIEQSSPEPVLFLLSLLRCWRSTHAKKNHSARVERCRDRIRLYMHLGKMRWLLVLSIMAVCSAWLVPPARAQQGDLMAVPTAGACAAYANITSMNETTVLYVTGNDFGEYCCSNHTALIDCNITVYCPTVLNGSSSSVFNGTNLYESGFYSYSMCPSNASTSLNQTLLMGNGGCPVSCDLAVGTALRLGTQSCSSDAFLQAQADAMLICGVNSYTSLARNAGGVCGVGVPNQGSSSSG